MGTTGKGYPYPEDTDPVAQGAQAIKRQRTQETLFDAIAHCS